MIINKIEDINRNIENTKNAAIEAFSSKHPDEAIKYVKELQKLDRQRSILMDHFTKYDLTKSDSD